MKKTFGYLHRNFTPFRMITGFQHPGPVAILLQGNVFLGPNIRHPCGDRLKVCPKILEGRGAVCGLSIIQQYTKEKLAEDEFQFSTSKFITPPSPAFPYRVGGRGKVLVSPGFPGSPWRVACRFN